MPTLQELLQKVDSYKQKTSSAPPLAKEELESLDNYFRIDFTYTSNALEGNTLTISKPKILLEDGIAVGGRPLKDCYEAVGMAPLMIHSRKTQAQQFFTLHTFSPFCRIFRCSLFFIFCYNYEKTNCTSSNTTRSLPSALPASTRFQS